MSPIAPHFTTLPRRTAHRGTEAGSASVARAIRSATLIALAATSFTVLGVQPARAQTAASQEPAALPDFSVRLDARTPGLIGAHIQAPKGTIIVAQDVTGESPDATRGAVAGPARDAPAYRTMKRSSIRLPTLAKWDCDTRDRALRFDLTFGTGGPRAQVTRTIRTPLCDKRVVLSVAPARAGQQIKATITDRHGNGGIPARVCAQTPRGAKQCQEITTPAGKRTHTLTLGRAETGRTVVSVKTPWGPRVQTQLVARSRTGGFRLLATGDSMIQIIDSYLGQRLEPRQGRVVSDAHISTGISKPSMLNWMRHAKGSAASVKPDVTVVFLGANDGFPMSGAACCGEDWQRIYASRVQGMMRSYLRGGRGRVIWLTLPAPRGSNFAAVFRGVNRAIEQAAARFRDDQVTVLDLRKTFTPGGRYRSSITWKGAHKQVRQGDGVHLNTPGASIAAELIISQLRRDGFVR